jgi:hypothetical protein
VRTFPATLYRFVAMLLIMSVPFLTAAADETRELKASFEVTIREGPSTGLVAMGYSH